MRFAAALLVSTLLVVGCGSSKPFTATADGNTFSIPGGWRALNDGELRDANSGFVGGLTRSAPGATGSISGAWCPTSLMGGAKEAAVMVVSVDVGTAVSVSDKQFFDNLKAGAKGGRMGVGVSVTDATFLGEPALRIEIPNTPIDGKPGKVASVWRMKGGKLKVVLYIATAEEYASYLPDFDKIAASAK